MYDNYQKNDIPYKMMEKKSNHNKFGGDTHKFEEDTHKFEQLDLNGKIVIRVKLRGYQKQFLETFYCNRDIGITQAQLFLAGGGYKHPNTVNNFIKTALEKGWITKENRIKGTRISSAYVDFIQPDHLSTGQIVKDKRFTYYKITEEGKRLFEIMEKLDGINN